MRKNGLVSNIQAHYKAHKSTCNQVDTNVVDRDFDNEN